MHDGITASIPLGRIGEVEEMGEVVRSCTLTPPQVASPCRCGDEPEVSAGPAGAQRHPERVEDEVGAHVRRELPADHAAAGNVDHERDQERAGSATERRPTD